MMHQIYSEINDYKTAYFMQSKAVELNDSLQNSDNIKKTTQLEMSYGFEQKMKLKEAEKENLKKLYESEIKRQRTITYGLVSILLAISTTIFLIIKNTRYVKKTNLILEEKNNEITNNHISIQEQYNELQKINSTKDKLFSIISHDLRSPISTLISITEVLIKQVDLTDTKKVLKILHAINNVAEKTYNLLENLLLWAKCQKGEIALYPGEISLHDVSEISISVLQETANEKEITIHNSVPENHVITGDFNMLMAVFRNLISNAIKFSHNGKNIYLSSNIDNAFCTVSVRDEGVGIEPKNIKKVFNIKDHFTTPGTSKESGSGLGLMLCKEFVEKHGGKIWVESEINMGSNFKFSIPI